LLVIVDRFAQRRGKCIVLDLPSERVRRDLDDAGSAPATRRPWDDPGDEGYRRDRGPRGERRGTGAVNPWSGDRMSESEPRAPERTRVAVVNDYEIVLHGLEAMLRPFRDRIEVVELDVERRPDQTVDVVLFDTYGHPRFGLDRVADLAHDPHVRVVAVYTWSFAPERLDAAVSENTVKTHLKSIFQKTSVTSRAEAIVRISRDASVSPRRHDQRGTPEPANRSPKGRRPTR
jgi:hypothetical protein